MRFALDILPEALSDISTATRWYEDQQTGLGDEFAAAVSRRIDELVEQALAYRIRYRRKNVRWTHPRRFPYRIAVLEKVEQEVLSTLVPGQVVRVGP